MHKNTKVDPQRIEWLDVLKAYTIFLVFVGHKTDNVLLEQIIYSFHVPLFFWISGFAFNRSKYNNFFNFLNKKIRTLLVPYFVFGLFSFIFWFVIVRSLSIRGQALSMDPLPRFWGIFYGVGVEPWCNPMDIAFWFLPCLFVTEIFFWFINSLFQVNVRNIVVILFLICGYLTTIWLPFHLPWSADVALTAIFFFHVGNITRFLDINLSEIRLGWKISLIFLLFFIMVLSSIINGKADMNYNHYGNMILFIIAALSGIYFSYLMLRELSVSHIISYVGQNTIILVGLGGISSFIIKSIYFVILKSFPIGEKMGLSETIIYSFLEIGLLLPVMYMINNYMPIIIGREGRNKIN